MERKEMERISIALNDGFYTMENGCIDEVSLRRSLQDASEMPEHIAKILVKYVFKWHCADYLDAVFTFWQLCNLVECLVRHETGDILSLIEGHNDRMQDMPQE